MLKQQSNDMESGSVCNIHDVEIAETTPNTVIPHPTSKDHLMKRERKTLLKDVTEKRHAISAKFRPLWRISCCSLKAETNLAIMLCLVFYLYICLGGALFLLLEGQIEAPQKPKQNMKNLLKSINVKFNGYNINKITKYCDEKAGVERRKEPMHENLWNFLEATDFAYQVITGQGTTQTTRILYTTGGRIAYIPFLLFGIPLTVLTLRATGQWLNIFVYASIRFINVKIFKRQLTSNIHIKALIFNTILFLFIIFLGSEIYYLTQKDWDLLDCVFYAISVVFTVSNSDEKLINLHIPLNSNLDKTYRAVFNLFTFIAYTVLASVTWSAHHFTRHMRFKAQNRQSKNGAVDASSTCPWVEVTRTKTNSPIGSRERETDRESVC